MIRIAYHYILSPPRSCSHPQTYLPLLKKRTFTNTLTDKSFFLSLFAYTTLYILCFSLGVEAAVWGETIRTAEHMYAMLSPRLLALAERAWHKAPWEDISDRRLRDAERNAAWVKFANTLSYRELGRLDKMAVPYRVPPPAGR